MHNQLLLPLQSNTFCVLLNKLLQLLCGGPLWRKIIGSRRGKRMCGRGAVAPLIRLKAISFRQFFWKIDRKSSEYSLDLFGLSGRKFTGPLNLRSFYAHCASQEWPVILLIANARTECENEECYAKKPNETWKKKNGECRKARRKVKAEKSSALEVWNQG